MAKEIPSVGDLRRKSEVTGDEVEAATTAYLKGEYTEPFAFKSVHTVDVAKAIKMHAQAKKLLADKATTPGLAPHDGDDRHHHGLPGPGVSGGLVSAEIDSRVVAHIIDGQSSASR